MQCAKPTKFWLEILLELHYHVYYTSFYSGGSCKQKACSTTTEAWHIDTPITPICLITFHSSIIISFSLYSQLQIISKFILTKFESSKQDTYYYYYYTHESMLKASKKFAKNPIANIINKKSTIMHIAKECSISYNHPMNNAECSNHMCRWWFSVIPLFNGWWYHSLTNFYAWKVDF